MNLRDQIAQSMDEFGEGYDQDCAFCNEPWVNEYTGRIIAIIREALLSEQAVEAGAISQWDYNKIGDEWPEWCSLGLDVKKIYREFTEVTANAMFAAAGLTGGQGNE